MPDAYATFAIEFEGDLSGVQSSMAQGLTWSRVYGQEHADAYASGFAARLASGAAGVSGGLGMLGNIRGQFASTAQGLSEVFGMRAGAEIAGFRRQLVGMTGDADLAQRTLDGLIKIANTTSYGNMDIFQMATSAMGSGTSAQNVVGEVGTLLDAAAGIGITDQATFKRFQRNLFQLKTRDGEANQRDVNELRAQAPQFMFQAAKALGVNVQDASQKVNSMTGKELYDLIVKIGQSNQGRAAASGMADPFAAAANAVDTFNTAMAPTGELINRFVTPLIVGGAQFAQGFAALNTAGGGLPGLALGIGVVIRSYFVYQGTIGRATLALNALALSANRAAGAQALGAKPGTFGSWSSAAAGTKLSGIPISLPEMIALGTAAGFTGAKYMSDNKQASPLFKGLDIASPAVFGGGGMLFNAFRGVDQLTGGKASSAIEKAAEKLFGAAEKLDDAADAAADGYGGGKRFKASLSSIEAGYALVGAERLGLV